MATLNTIPDTKVEGIQEQNRVLQWRGKFARILRGSQDVVSILDQGVVSIANFTTGLVIGRACGKEELGVYALGWTLLTAFTDISAALITTPYSIAVPHMSASQRIRYFASMLAHQVLCSLCFSVLAGLGLAIALLREPRSRSLWTALSCAVAISSFVGVREFARRVSFCEMKSTTVLVLDTAICAAQVIAVLALARSGLLTAMAAFMVLGFVCAVGSGGWMLYRRTTLSFTAATWLKDLKENWQIGKWLLASGVLWTCTMYLYPWLIACFHGTQATGIWAACSGVVAIGNPILIGLSNSIGPKVPNIYATRGVAAMRRYVYRRSIILAGLLIPFFVFLLFYGDTLVARIYGRTYVGNGRIAALLGLNIVLVAFTFPYSRGLFALRCAKADTRINIVAVVLLFTAGTACVWLHGAVGAAFALVSITAVTAALRVGQFAIDARH